MIYRYFNKNYHHRFFIIIICLLALWLPHFISTPFPFIPTVFHNYFEDFSLVINTNAYVIKAFCIISILIQGYLLNVTVAKNRLLGITNLSCSLFYLLLMGFNSHSLFFYPAILSNFFMILFLYYILENFDCNTPLLGWFNASLIVGLCTLIHPGNIILLAVIWGTLIIYRIYRFREWVISILGILIVFIFYFSYYFLYDIHFEPSLHFLNIFVNNTAKLSSISAFSIIPMAIFLLTLTMFIFLKVISSTIDYNLATRKRLSVLFLLLIACWITVILFSASWPFFIMQLFIPFSILLALLFEKISKNTIKELIVLILFALIIIERFINNSFF